MFVEGAGIAILLVANLLLPVLSPYHIAIYHSPVSASALAAGLSIDLTLAAAVFALVLSVLDRWNPEQTKPVWALLVGLCIAKAVDLAVFQAKYYLMAHYRANLPWTLTNRVALMCLTLGAGLFLSIRFPSMLQRSIKAARFGLLAVGCCIFWMLPLLVFTAVRTRAAGANAFVKPLRVSSPRSQDRVVWILLDELSYDQVFEHRQSDVKLPHFDELNSESVVFSDVQPAGYYTDQILPSLFLGRDIDDIRSSFDRDLEVHNARTLQWERFDAEASIFGEAKRSGWTTGVAGWFNPYCRILEDVLDACFWQRVDPFPRKLSPETPPLADALAFPADWWLSRVRATRPELERRAHTLESKDLAGAAASLIRNESIRFVFIHLPVPHPQGIYDRKTDTLGAKGTYLDNLVLADKIIGNLLTAIQRTSAAPRTTLIVSSDHSWRTNMWRGEAGWTAEEERASGGKFDPRPVLLIRFPGEQTGELKTEPFPELETYNMIRALLRNQFDSPDGVDRWVAEQQRRGRQNLAVNQSP